jgi:LssY-like putative type I secretion system component LssY
MKAYGIVAFCVLSLTVEAQSGLQGKSTPGQNSGPAVNASPLEFSLVVSSREPWTDTHQDLHRGDVIQVRASAGRGGCSPDGVSDSPAAALPVSTALPGALIAKTDDGPPFLVGSNKILNIEQPGRLFLGMNAGGKPPCRGDIAVRLQLTPAPVAAQIKSKLAAAAQTWLSGQFGTGTPQVAPSPGISGSAPTTSIPATPANPATLKLSNTPLDPTLAKDLDSVPRRVSDEFKNLGDMVNFIVIGTQQKLQTALSAAHWQLADQSTQVAVVSAIVETYENKDYLRMPMSTLYLFNRPQDFGYEQAEAYSVVASRHHCRIWKAPFTWNGQTVWIGAGTHDIGFEQDQRNGKVTHKIDPAVDGERDHIGESLQQTGEVQSVSYYLPPQPVREAKNATGGSYHSDGRLLVISLK